MKKIIFISAIALIFAGCAGISFAKLDWSGVNNADLTNLQAGKIAQPGETVAVAVADVLTAEGWQLEKAAAGGTVTTVRKHGVTVYGSCDYAVSCALKEEAGVTKLNWTMISYVTQFLTNVDPMSQTDADMRNIAVYKKLVESGKIARETKPAEAAPAATVTEAPAGENKDLPTPPKEEDVE